MHTTSISMLTHIFITGMERPKYEPVALYGGGGKKISTFIQSTDICVLLYFINRELT